MMLAHALEAYLGQRCLNYELHTHQAEPDLAKLCHELGIEPEQIAVPVMLQTSKKATLMAVIPLAHQLDINRLRALLQRDFKLMDSEDVPIWFNNDIEVGAEPPVPGPYGLPCIVDRSLMQQQRLFMRSGSHACLLSMDADSVQQLYSPYPKAVISNLTPAFKDIPDQEGRYPELISQLHEVLEKVHRLPAMPALAFKIIQQVNDADTSASDLAETIELDPSVAAQVIRYAGSPYFGYRGRLNSVQEAITRVLGFELVSNIAFGIASGKAFNVKQEGPIGLKAYWKHALYCAVVTQGLARKINQPDLVNPGQAYMCGLMHNIGVLVIGHLFPAEFNRLNALLTHQPGLPLYEAEKEILSVGHDHVGGYILEKWKLPTPVVDCAYHHHIENYQGDNNAYVRLVQLSNHLLAQHEIGDLGFDTGDRLQCSEGLIDLSDADAVFEKVMEMCFEIDSLADYIAA